MNGPKNTYDRTIELDDVASGALGPTSPERSGDGDYAWMPDSREFRFRSRAPKQKPQLYRYTLATRKVVALTNIKQGVSGPVVSHRGERIALPVSDPAPVARGAVRLCQSRLCAEGAQKKSDIRKIDTLFFEPTAKATRTSTNRTSGSSTPTAPIPSN